MIDRALAEDLASVFEVQVEEIPLDISELVGFIEDYIRHHAEEEGVFLLTFRLQVVAERLHDMLGRMASRLDG